MIARTGGSFTKKDAPNPPKTPKERAGGRKERQANLTEAEPPVLRPSTSAAVEHDEDLKPWKTAVRPPGAEAPKDDSFILEDEAVASFVETVMFCLTVSSPSLEDNPIVYASPGFESVTGYTHDEVLGQNCRLLQGAQLDPESIKTLDEGFTQQGFFSVELTNYHRDGTSFQNLLCIMPLIKSPSGSNSDFSAQPSVSSVSTSTASNLSSRANSLQCLTVDRPIVMKYVGVQCDLDTQRKRGETISEDFVKRWSDNVCGYVSALLLTDSSMEHVPMVICNTGFTELTGYSMHDIQGNSILALCGPGTSTKAMKKLIMSTWVVKAGAHKMLLYKKDGTPFWAYMLSCPLAEGRASLSRQSLHILIDITSSKCKRIGRYIMGKVIGQGAFGLVRIAKNPQTDDIVAIKGVDASKFRSIREIEMIQEEMNVLSGLKHPNIIRLLEIQFVNSVFFLVMDYASGGSLVSYIKKNNPEGYLKEGEAKRLFLQTAQAVDYCHRRRIVHRDLKPENILMDENGDVQIADFGLAAVTAPFSKGLTDQVGTPQFTAPEIINRKEYEGPSVDIWSLGVILYEALSGELPFKGASTSALYRSICRGMYDPLPLRLSADCKDLVARMLIVDPDSRITMEEIMKHSWCRATSSPHVSVGGLCDRRLSDATAANGQKQQLSSDPLDLRSRRGTNDESGGSPSPFAIPNRTSVAIPVGVLSRDPAFSPLSDGSGSYYSAEEAYSPVCPRPRNSRDAYRPTSQEVHDSARIVFNDSNKDDPITQAIMRGHLAAGQLAEQKSEEGVNGASKATRKGKCPVAPRSAAATVSSTRKVCIGTTTQDREKPTPPRTARKATNNNNTAHHHHHVAVTSRFCGDALASEPAEAVNNLPPIPAKLSAGAGLKKALSAKKLNLQG